MYMYIASLIRCCDTLTYHIVLEIYMACRFSIMHCDCQLHSPMFSFLHTFILSFHTATGRPVHSALPPGTVCTPFPQPDPLVQPLPLGHHQRRPPHAERANGVCCGPRVWAPAHYGKPGPSVVRPPPEWPSGAGACGLQG